MSNYDAYPEFVPEVNPWVVPVERTEEGTPSTTYPGELLQGEAAAAALDQYEAAGEHLAVPRIPEDETFSADGATFDKYGTENWQAMRDRLDPAATEERLKTVGLYAMNNLKLAYVDQTGSLMMARCTTNNVHALRGAGFREGDVYVPFSKSEEAAPGSLASLHLDLFRGLNEVDRRTTGERVHNTDFYNAGDTSAARFATRQVIHLESSEEADQRVTNEMDPERDAVLDHAIQSLRDQIAFKKLDQLMGDQE